MGASENKQPQLPEYGFKIINLQSQSTFQLFPKLNIMVDYIISPDVTKLDLTQQSIINLQVFSVLNYKTRTVSFPVKQNRLGIGCKYTKINYCVLKITNVFKDSPCQNSGILNNQFIVGVVNGQFSSIKQFAILLKAIMQSKRQTIVLGVCNQLGLTRSITLLVKQLKKWNSIQKKGYLGCQLAEGLANKWTSKTLIKDQHIGLTETKHESKDKTIQKLRQTKIQPEKQSKQLQKTLMIKTIPKQIPKQINNQPIAFLTKEKSIQIYNSKDDDSFSSDEINQKCSQFQMSTAKHYVARQKIWNITKKQNTSQNILQISFKDDASTLCRCKPYNKHCQKCFMVKDNSYYFFNKKTNRIIIIQQGMFFPQKSSV